MLKKLYAYILFYIVRSGHRRGWWLQNEPEPTLADLRDPIPLPVPLPQQAAPSTETPDLSQVNIELPEAMIQHAANVVGGNNHFHQLLSCAQVYRTANLDPIYLTNENQSIIRVAARDYFEHPFMLN